MKKPKNLRLSKSAKQSWKKRREKQIAELEAAKKKQDETVVSNFAVLQEAMRPAVEDAKNRYSTVAGKENLVIEFLRNKISETEAQLEYYRMILRALAEIRGER